MAYPNRMLDNSRPKTLADYRRDEEQRDSDALARSEAAKQGALTRKANKLRKDAEAAVAALSPRAQMVLAKQMLRTALSRAGSRARNALDGGEHKQEAGRAYWEVNSAINGLKDDLDQAHKNWDWFVSNFTKKG